MSDNAYFPASGSPAWRRYLDREHEARDTYLALTARAHREYLTGPWPDRDAYTHVERTAWINYYQAGREAWQNYVRDLATPPGPPPPPPPVRVPEAVTGTGWPPSPGSHPYPAYGPRPESGQ